VGGTFFPFEMMPDWLAAIGRLTPNGWAILQLKAFLAGAVEPARLALTLAGLAAVGTLSFLLALRRLRGKFLF
jgi:ABC-type multidrug transport system permease subunit